MGGMIWFVFIAGLMLDKFSARKLTAGAFLFVAVTVFLRGQAKGFEFFFTVQFIYGVASAFYFPAVAKMISLWFDSKELAVANGAMTSAAPLGQLCANLFTVNIAGALGGWRMMYIVVAVATAVMVIVFFVTSKERKNIDAALSTTLVKDEKDLGLLKNVKSVLSTPQVWLYMVANICFLGVIYAAMTYQNLVLQLDPKWGLSVAASGTIPAFSNIASMISYTLVPFLLLKFNLIKKYRTIGIVCAFIVPLLFLYGWQSYNVSIFQGIMLCTGLLFGPALPQAKLGMLELPEVSGPRAGTAMGVYLTAERFGTTLFITALGTIMGATPNATVVAWFTQLMFITPILLIIANVLNKRSLRKREAQAQTQAQ